MSGRVCEGLLETLVLEPAHKIWVGLCQKEKGRKKEEDISGRGNGVSQLWKGTLCGRVCSTGHMDLARVRDTYRGGAWETPEIMGSSLIMKHLTTWLRERICSEGIITRRAVTEKWQDGPCFRKTPLAGCAGPPLMLGGIPKSLTCPISPCTNQPLLSLQSPLLPLAPLLSRPTWVHLAWGWKYPMLPASPTHFHSPLITTSFTT